MDIGLFANKETEQATLEFYEELAQIDFPEGLSITINNTTGAESGILREADQPVELSLANCYSLADAVREMARLILAPRFDEAEELGHRLD
jgi:hypothetical protein